MYYHVNKGRHSTIHELINLRSHARRDFFTIFAAHLKQPHQFYMSNINDDGNGIMPDDNDNHQQGATHSGVVALGQIDIDPKRFGATPDTEALPILPTRNLVLFP